MKKKITEFMKPVYLAVGIAISAAVAAVDDFDMLGDLTWWEGIILGAITAAAGVIHKELEDADTNKS